VCECVCVCAYVYVSVCVYIFVSFIIIVLARVGCCRHTGGGDGTHSGITGVMKGMPSEEKTCAEGRSIVPLRAIHT
jgi:hypothetical protein